MKSKVWPHILRAFVSILAIGLLIYFMRDKLHEAAKILRSEVIWSWFVIGILTYLAGLAILAARLLFVFRVQTIRLSFLESFYLGFVGLFFNLVFPSAVGGDIAKAYYAYKHSGKKLASMTAVIMDRLMGFVALILMAIVSLFFLRDQLNDPRLDMLICGALVVVLFSMAFFASKRFARQFKFLLRLIPSDSFKNRMNEAYQAVHKFRHHYGTLFFCIGLSLVGQSFFVLVHYWVTRSLNVSIDLWLYFIFVPIITIVSMVPSLGGLGFREVGVTYLFSRYMSAERALAVAVLLDVIIYGFSFLGGLIYSMQGGLKKKMIHEMETLSHVSE